MKQYKLLQDVWPSQMEEKLNALAEDGWVVKSFTTIAEGEDNSNIQYHILMEYDDANDDTNTAIVEAIDNVNGKVTEMEEGFRALRESLRNIVGALSEVNSTLDQISNNTDR
jgi:hypothetical protein